MRISLIVAVDEAGGIGIDNRLPWRLPDDQKRFKALTMGHTLIMGRRTYDSIGRALPGRTMIVITRNPAFHAEGVAAVGSLEQALEIARQGGETEAFIAGGAHIFSEAFPLADRVYLTKVHAVIHCDVYFPPFDPEEWKELESSFHSKDDRNEHDFTFTVYERVKNTGVRG